MIQIKAIFTRTDFWKTHNFFRPKIPFGKIHPHVVYHIRIIIYSEFEKNDRSEFSKSVSDAMCSIQVVRYAGSFTVLFLFLMDLADVACFDKIAFILELPGVQLIRQTAVNRLKTIVPSVTTIDDDCAAACDRSLGAIPLIQSVAALGRSIQSTSSVCVDSALSGHF